MATKKAAPKKIASKKTIPKKAASKKPTPKKTKPKKVILKEIVSVSAMVETPISGDCMCKQKKPNGKYFSFRLEQGRWVQSSAVPFSTKELCEEVNC